MQPLGATGLLAGMVPMLTDDDSCNAAYTFLNVPTKTCSTLLCCLTLLNGNAGPYTIRVADSSQFTIGDILQIGSRTDRFTVTNIIDATHIQATVNPVPVGNQDIDAGTSICIVDCCEIIQDQLHIFLTKPRNLVHEN
jgi:hypothetical protein